MVKQFGVKGCRIATIGYGFSNSLSTITRKKDARKTAESKYLSKKQKQSKFISDLCFKKRRPHNGEIIMRPFYCHKYTPDAAPPGRQPRRPGAAGAQQLHTSSDQIRKTGGKFAERWLAEILGRTRRVEERHPGCLHAHGTGTQQLPARSRPALRRSRRRRGVSDRAGSAASASPGQEDHRGR